MYRPLVGRYISRAARLYLLGCCGILRHIKQTTILAGRSLRVGVTSALAYLLGGTLVDNHTLSLAPCQEVALGTGVFWCPVCMAYALSQSEILPWDGRSVQGVWCWACGRLFTVAELPRPGDNGPFGRRVAGRRGRARG